MYVCTFLRKMKESTAEAGGPPPREAERERKREREEEGEKGRERERDPQGHLNKNPPHQVWRRPMQGPGRISRQCPTRCRRAARP